MPTPTPTPTSPTSGFQLRDFAEIGLDEPFLRILLAEHAEITRPRLERLWTYYRNPQKPLAPRALNLGNRVSDELGSVGVGGSGGGGGSRSAFRGDGGGGEVGVFVLGQETGLPSRITGSSASSSRREVVIENDIGWRVQTMVDFMFGKPLRIASLAADPALAAMIDAVLDQVWEASGGIALFQDAALLGHVFGSVDLLLGVDEAALHDVARFAPTPTPTARHAEDPARFAARVASHLIVEVVDPRRSIPIPDPADYRRLLGYILHHDHELNEAHQPAWWERAIGRTASLRARTTRTRILSATHWQQYDGPRLAHSGETPWTLGRVPVAHIQNIAEPWKWHGLGEVEPLIPIQNELNTRLSDRAHRVTMQSFKMYLAKGVDGFDKVPIAPGQVWSTDNMDASVQAFGGDASSPSEEEHIKQLREAMDKISGLPPVAGGVVQGKIGNLSSANALRVTLMSVLAKTARKRVTYGRGIAEICGMILGALDWAGVLKTTPADRRVRLEWPDPLPTDPADPTSPTAPTAPTRDRGVSGSSREDPGIQ